MFTDKFNSVCANQLDEDQLWAAVIGIGPDGSPILKVRTLAESAGDANILQYDIVQGTTAANLKTALTAWKATNSTVVILRESLTWDGTHLNVLLAYFLPPA